MNKFDQNRDSLFSLLVLPLLILGFFAVGEASGYAQTAQSLTNFYRLEPGNPYVINVNITQEAEEGIDITLDQTILNHGQLIFSLLISGDLPENTVNADTGPFHCYLNGEELTSRGAGDTAWQDGKIPVLMLLYSMELPFQSEPLWYADFVTIKLDLPYLVIYSIPQNEKDEYISYSIEGPWSFEFEISGAAIAADAETYALSKTYEALGETYTMNELVITPINIRIYTASTEEQQLAILYYLIVTDDGSEILLQFRQSIQGKNIDEMGRLDRSLLYMNDPNDAKSEQSGNPYALIEKSASLTVTPLLQNDPFAWPILVENTIPLESESVTILRKP